MYDTTQLAVPKSTENIFGIMMLLYPSEYRVRFGHEMFLVFQDMYFSEIEKTGKVGILFWLSQIADMTTSVIEQHKLLIIKKGMKKYLQQTLPYTIYNIIGGILLLPFFTLFAIDFAARIAQGNMTHYNRPVYAFLSHTPLYWSPVLFSIAILFPAIAVLLNVIPLAQQLIKKHISLFSFTFLKQNIVSLVLLIIALGFLANIKLHDFVPCFVHGITRIGLNIPQIYSVCKNA